MANSNTRHSKQLRAKSAKKAREKILNTGGISINVLLKKEDGADELRELINKTGSKSAAIKYLIKIFQENQN